MKRKAIQLFGLLLLFYLLSSIGFGRILSTITGANPLPLLLSFILIFPFTFFQAMKWKRIAEMKGIEAGLKPLYLQWMEGLLYGMLTPGKVGSFIRVKRLSELTGQPLSRCLPSVLLDRLIDLISVFTLASLGAIVLAGEFSSLVIPSLTLLALLSIATLVVTNKNLTKKLLKRFFENLVPDTHKAELRSSFHSFYKGMPSPRSLFPIFLFSLFIWAYNYSLLYLVALSVGIDLPLHLFVLLPPIATLVGLIPITVGGFGTREATLVALFSPYGVPADKIVGMSLLGAVLLGYLPPIIFNMIEVFTSKKGK